MIKNPHIHIRVGLSKSDFEIMQRIFIDPRFKKITFKTFIEPPELETEMEANKEFQDLLTRIFKSLIQTIRESHSIN